MPAAKFGIYITPPSYKSRVAQEINRWKILKSWERSISAGRMIWTTVTGFLKEKLPAPSAGQVDNAISGAGGAGVDKVGDVAAKVGGMFGK